MIASRYLLFLFTIAAIPAAAQTPSDVADLVGARGAGGMSGGAAGPGGPQQQTGRAVAAPVGRATGRHHPTVTVAAHGFRIGNRSTVG